MAGVALVVSGTTSCQCKYTDGDGDWGGLVLSVTAVRYVASTNKLEIDWSTQFISKSTGRPYIGGLRAVVAGSEQFFNTGSPLYNYTYAPYKNQETYLTGTVTVDASKGTTQNISLLVEGLFGRYYSSSAWTNYKVSGSATATVPVPNNPTLSVSISKTQANRGGSDGSATATITASAGTNGGSITAYSNTNNGSTNSSSTNTASSLKNNTSYSYSATVTNTYGLTASTSGTYYLDPVGPSWGAYVTNITSTTATIGYGTVTYDTNRKFGSVVYKYGTSTSYGSTSSNGQLTGLQPNTTYYYRIEITDANNGGPYSSGITTANYSSFTTLPGVMIKTSDTWNSGVAYIKVDGNWRQGQVYIKIDGSWRLSG